ncbi:ABC transporter permease [Tumebacillus flagellatus]|uniref:ABC transporter permease n=1 Tax=Tumebacillus flagellatus TaxID=1157490 RepID=A0A074LV65_9BACL|nr:ABC transporter permease [Tumebacillus flagellatus]KEO83868.1 ABC transporter permease [Tumebacillus flagellatus]
MRNLLALTRNETLKVLRKRRFFVVILILLILIPTFVYGQYTTEQRLLAKVGTTDWRAQLQQQITDQEHRMQSPALPDEQKKIMQLQVEQQKYYLDRNINPKATGATTFTRFFMQYGVSLFLPLLVIVIATDIVSSEHSEGTIKLLLTRPVKRWKILLSKYLTLLIYTTLTVMITMVACYAISGLFFGFQGWDAPMFTGFQISGGTFDASQVKVLPHWQLLLMNYGLGWISTIVVATLSFMVSVLVRGTAAGMGVMLAVLIGGNILVQLAADFPIAKYIFTSHLRLTDYVNGTPLPIPDVTLPFSLCILGLWLVGGLIVSFITFTRRDVLA